jgi:hypothetical protein
MDFNRLSTINIRKIQTFIALAVQLSTLLISGQVTVTCRFNPEMVSRLAIRIFRLDDFPTLYFQ